MVKNRVPQRLLTNRNFMKVLHLINGEFYSGAERVQDLLGKNLGELGVSVGFACLKPRLFPSARAYKDVPVIDVSMSSKFDFSVAPRIASVIKNEGYQALHTHTPRAALIGRISALLAGVPMVHHVHSPTSRDTESSVRNFVNSKIENFSLASVAKLIVVSESLGRHVVSSGFSPDLVAVVPNGVPVVFDSVSWSRKGPNWVIGTVALFRPRKGLEVLLEAFSTLITRGFHLSLRAVGAFETPEYERQIKAFTAHLKLDDHVTWTGFTTDVAAELQKMDMFVLPSLFGEGLPMVVLEALAAGLPVVSTDVEGIPEVLGVNGAGMIVRAGDVSALVDGLYQIISSTKLAKDMAVAGHARQRERYSDVAMAQGVFDVYKNVIQ